MLRVVLATSVLLGCNVTTEAREPRPVPAEVAAEAPAPAAPKTRPPPSLPVPGASPTTGNPPGVPHLDGPLHEERGIAFIDEVVGTGATPTTGQRVEVHYTGWLDDGTQFDSSRDRGQPIVIGFDRGMVIKGWDLGLASMRVGGKRRVIIPPELGYGERGAGGVIPPGATLIFDIELLDVGGGDGGD